MTDRATTFLAAFNDIESHLRDTLNAGDSQPFWKLVDWSKNKRMLTDEQAAQLKDFAKLRNAISHGQYYGDQPTASPHEDVVADIVDIRNKLLTPPLALSLLPAQKVLTVDPDDNVATVLDIIREHDVSQIPVYDDGRFVRLLTMNAVARWVAHHVDDDLAASHVSDLLDYLKDHERALIVHRDVTALEAYDLLTKPGTHGETPRALIISEHGKPDQKPIRVISPRDLHVLVDAL